VPIYNYLEEFSLHSVDWSVIGLYFLFIIWRGFRYVKQHENAEQYFLAGRRLVWPLIGLSLFASNMSSSSLVGLAGSGYETGISVFSYEWMAAIVLIIFAIFFLPYYLRSKIYTLPEFLEKRYDARVRYYFSGLTIITNIGIDTAATLYAGALVIQLIFPSVELWQSILVLAGVIFWCFLAWILFLGDQPVHRPKGIGCERHSPWTMGRHIRRFFKTNHSVYYDLSWYNGSRSLS
jgi:SSS family solute:Na+ symporter